MDLNELPPAVQKLATIGGGWEEEGWPDYRALGIDPEHITESAARKRTNKQSIKIGE
jgi:hypothetical protein